MRLFGPALAALGTVALAAVALAQEPCTAARLPISIVRTNVPLTPTQEADLGDAMAEHLERSYGVVRGQENEHLQALGDRIVAELPPSGLTFHFTLVNMATVNAFATPGGRIYVSRKLVAFANNDDEVAGVLGHEIGHVLSRQLAADVVETFRRVLKVSTFGDRKDIFEKYHRLVDSDGRRSDDGRSGEDHQYEADRVALIAIARAGFSPDAYIELWDRFNQTNHKTGNFLTDLLASTRPESRRLREMVHSMAAVPVGCRTVQVASADSFKAWQRRVVESTGRSAAAEQKAVLSERRLDPPLRSDITSLKFSPNGRFALAQDDSTIYVLSREPLAVLFQIDAEDARPARFSPDSTRVVFSTPALRVEWWDIATAQRKGAYELVSRFGAIQSELSPDGSVLAFVDGNQQLFQIHLVAVDTGAELYKAELPLFFGGDYVEPTNFAGRGDLELFQLTFSPDGRYFLVGGQPHDIAFDMSSRSEVKLPDHMRQALRRQFVFLGADRGVVVDKGHPEQSAIVGFPSGDAIKTLTLGGRATAATRGDFVMLRPVNGWPVGLMDLTSGHLVLAAKTLPLDVYDDLRLSELPNGDIGLFRGLSKAPESSVALPVSNVGGLMGVAVSDDLTRVALSVGSRGAVWATDTGSRLGLMRGFRGGFLDEPGVFYADFPKRQDVREGKLIEIDRLFARVDLASGNASQTLAPSGPVRLAGRVYATSTAAKPGQWDRDITFAVQDVRTNAVVWTRRFANEMPHVYYDVPNQRVIFDWDLDSAEGKAQLKADAALRAQAGAPELQDGALLLEVASLVDGAVSGRVLVAAGRPGPEVAWGYYLRKVQSAVSAANLLAIADRSSQVLVYSTTGKRVGSVFGRFAVISPTGLLMVQNAEGELTIYDGQTLERKASLLLPSRVRVARFNADSSRLLLVTADQTARLIDTAALLNADAAAK